MDEIEYARMRNLIKNELDYQSGMVEARREGLAEGLNKASLDIAYKVKNAGRPLSEIMEFTGLPMETITQL